MLPKPRIAIIGAGPAGLTAGLLLHNRGIEATIFELRQQPTAEELDQPSGMLDLHDESGLAAIRECGLYDEFLKLTGECAEVVKIVDMAGNILYEEKESDEVHRPEISRHALTKLLSSHLPADAIQWNHKLLGVSSCPKPNTGTEIELDFGPRGKRVVDLVIGADGAWSRVRSLLTDVKPYYSERQILTATARHVTSKYPHIAALVGRGGFSALGLRHGLMSQRGLQDSARMYIVLTTADEDFATTSGIEGCTPAEAKHRLLEDDALLGRWGDILKEMVSVVCDEDSADHPAVAVDIKPLYMLPIGTSWEHKAGATLIGDAAHLMCPWAGEGVNLAMWDSLLLARNITQAYNGAREDGISFQDALNPLMVEFEADMAARAKEKAEMTYSNGEMMFGQDGATAFAKFFLNAHCVTPKEGN